MTQADRRDSPQERLVHYLEMANKAHEAARNPTADLQVRNLYTWVAKSWEMLAMDELDKLRSASHNAPKPRPHRIRAVPSRGRTGSQMRAPRVPVRD